ncbi:MAG: Fe-S cluster assembly protein SufD [Acidimicrobiales bacterium]|nr:Fe-S cluster assembly protein SufD [Acidimicrobiales bacterium]
MSSLNPATAAALDGPSWLRSFRTAAAERFATAPRPDKGEEIWRYSRIDELDLDGFPPAGAALDPPPDAVVALADALGETGGVVVLANGRIVRAELAAAVAAQGVRLGGAASFEDGAGLLDGGGAPDDALVLANSAFGVDPVVLAVPRGVRVERPIVVIDWSSSDGGAAFSRLVVRAAQGSEVRVVHHQRSDERRSWLAPVVELFAAPDARISYGVVQDLGPAVWQTATVAAVAEQQASVEVVAAAFGGDYARLRIDLRLVGRGATGKLAAAYFADGEQMLDFRTLQDHQGPDCTSDLLFKGVVDDRSHSVYSGMIRVRPAARGTNAFQTNRNIKLSEDAWAESVPNLEIETNDVRCSHASTVGPIDLEQRFYLESRGVPTRRAEQLIVNGFFDEVISRLPDELRPAVTARIAEKLGER